jgi:hypothetical protein
MNKPVLDAQTLQNLAEGDRAVISGFQGTIQVGAICCVLFLADAVSAEQQNLQLLQRGC